MTRWLPSRWETTTTSSPRSSAAACTRAAKALDPEYMELLREGVAETLYAGFDDHTAELTPQAYQQLAGQVRRFDSKGKGRLDLEDFCRLCEKLGEAAQQAGLSDREAAATAA